MKKLLMGTLVMVMLCSLIGAGYAQMAQTHTITVNVVRMPGTGSGYTVPAEDGLQIRGSQSRWLLPMTYFSGETLNGKATFVLDGSKAADYTIWLVGVQGAMNKARTHLGAGNGNTGVMLSYKE